MTDQATDMSGPETVALYACRMLAKHGATREQLDRNLPAITEMANAAMNAENFRKIMAGLANLNARLAAGDGQVGRLCIGPGAQQ